MIFTIRELFDIIIMTAAIGFIFKDTFRPPLDPDQFIQQKENNFWYAVAAVAPAIILHELGHKFTAMAYGIQATFHAAYTFLGLGILLKIFSFPFIFFIPAYVSHPPVSAAPTIAIAIMGPLTNLALAGLSKLAIIKKFQPTYTSLFQTTYTVNIFLFVLNMLPIPGIDGFAVYKSIGTLLF